MVDGVYTLSSSLLHSLLEKERVAAGDSGVGDAKRRAAGRADLPDFSEDLDRVTSVRRDREARWICAMGRRLGLGVTTVGVAITVFDRVLGAVLVQAKYVNCVALASLYLAVKLHEECFVALAGEPARDSSYRASSVSLNSEHSSLVVDADAFENDVVAADDSDDFDWSAADASYGGAHTAETARHADNYYLDASEFLACLRVDYTPRELTRMETEVLRLLDWDLLALASSAQFVEAMLAVVGAPHLAASPALRANYEAVIVRWQLAGHFGASTLALALLSLMFQTSFGAPLAQCVTHALAGIFQVDSAQLAECRAQTADVLRRFHAQQAARSAARASCCASPAAPFFAASRRAASSSPAAMDEKGHALIAVHDKSAEDAAPTPAKTSATLDTVDEEIVSVLYGILDAQQ